LGLGGGVNHAKKTNKLRLTQWLKLGVTVVRGGGGGVLVHHYFLSKKPLILERLETLEKSWFFHANCLSDSLAIPKKIALMRKVLLNSPFPVLFPQSSQEREWVSPWFPFPQDLRNWPSLIGGISICNWLYSQRYKAASRCLVRAYLRTRVRFKRYYPAYILMVATVQSRLVYNDHAPHLFSNTTIFRQLCYGFMCYLWIDAAPFSETTPCSQVQCWAIITII
jgi:hypothetical protein